MRYISTFTCALVSATLWAQTSPNGFGILPGSNTPLGIITPQTGVSYVRVQIAWSAAEPQQGQLGFNTSQDQAIAAAEAAGFRVFPTVSIGRGWMNGQSGSTGTASYPPLDLQNSPDASGSYSAGYSNFISQLLTHYRGHFDWIVIENEPNSTTYWGGTADQYVRVVKTASKAAKLGDPGVKVADGGMSSDLWGLAVAKDWIATRVHDETDAVQWAYDYYNLEQPQGAAGTLTSTSAISQVLDDPNSTFNTDQYPKLMTIVDGLSGVVDGLNLHFFQSSQFVPVVSDWLKGRARRAPIPYTPQILSNEMGIRTKADAGCSQSFPFSNPEAEQQARWTFRSLVSARAGAVDPVVWFSVDTVCGTSLPYGPYYASVFNPPPSNSSRVAGQSLRSVVNRIGAGGYRLNKALVEGPDKWAYLFQDPAGNASLAAAWTIDGTTRTVSIPSAGYRTITIYDYKGQLKSQQTLIADTLNLDVSNPVFVVFSGSIPVPVTTVNAASFLTGQVTPDSLVSAFGKHLAATTAYATGTLATTLGGTTVTLRDADGVNHAALLLYVSPTQVNFLVPDKAGKGEANLTITSGDGTASTGTITLTDYAPGLFAKNGDGKGVAAANLIRVRNGVQTMEEVAQFDQASHRWVTKPINLGPAGDEVFLVLYGTGIRQNASLLDRVTIGGVTLPVSYAGPQGEFAGLDQVNVPLSRLLAGKGDVEVGITFSQANIVHINVQ